jgi:hypothetical protein
MIQSVIDGIIAALLDAYPDAEIYEEQAKQGLQEPCFLVRSLNVTNDPMLGDRRRRRSVFSIQYFAESDTDAKSECYGVRDALFQILEYITVDGDLTRGVGMNGEVMDDILSFTVSYNIFLRPETDIPFMEDLTVESGAG